MLLPIKFQIKKYSCDGEVRMPLYDAMNILHHLPMNDSIQNGPSSSGYMFVTHTTETLLINALTHIDFKYVG